MAEPLRRFTDGLILARQLLWLAKTRRWSPEQVSRYQHQALHRQLTHAFEAVPYYRDLDIPVRQNDPLGTLSELPLLSKTDIQQAGQRLLTNGRVPGDGHSSTTSGSAGQPTTTWFDRESWLLTKYALKLRRTLQYGRGLGERLMIFDESSRSDGGIEAPRKLRLPGLSVVRLSTFTPLSVQKNTFAELRPTMIYGSPSGLCELADYIGKNTEGRATLGTLFTSSELLSDDKRRYLSAAFGARVVDVYGSTEFKEVAVQCPFGRYHINIESTFVETVPDAHGHRVVLTSLVNRAMPLLRMDIGDYASIDDSPCSCGVATPTLDAIRGREVEYLELSDGERLSPYYLTTHVETIDGIERYQFVQCPGGRIELHVVARPGVTAADTLRGALSNTLQALLGQNQNFTVRIVDAIERSPAGKHKIVAKPTP